MTESTPLRMEKLLKLVKEDKGMAQILPDGKIMLRIDSDTRENMGAPQAHRNLSSEHGEPGTRSRVRVAPVALPLEGATGPASGCPSNRRKAQRGHGFSQKYVEGYHDPMI